FQQDCRLRPGFVAGAGRSSRPPGDGCRLAGSRGDGRRADGRGASSRCAEVRDGFKEGALRLLQDATQQGRPMSIEEVGRDIYKVLRTLVDMPEDCFASFT